MVFSEAFLLQDLIVFGLIWLGITIYFATRARVARLAVPAP